MSTPEVVVSIALVKNWTWPVPGAARARIAAIGQSVGLMGVPQVLMS